MLLSSISFLSFPQCFYILLGLNIELKFDSLDSSPGFRSHIPWNLRINDLWTKILEESQNLAKLPQSGQTSKNLGKQAKTRDIRRIMSLWHIIYPNFHISPMLLVRILVELATRTVFFFFFLVMNAAFGWVFILLGLLGATRGTGVRFLFYSSHIVSVALIGQLRILWTNNCICFTRRN